MYPYIYVWNSQVYLYSLCVFCGSIASLIILTTFLRKQKLLHIYIPIVAIGLIGLVVGAKLCGIMSKCLYNLSSNGNLKLYDSILNSGIVYLGGLIGFLCTVRLMCYLRKKNKYLICNMLAVVIPLFHAFGRIGCFFAGCCYGREHVGWFSLPYRIGFQGKWIDRFPVQLIEAGFELMMFSVLFVIYIRKQKEQVHRNSILMDSYLVAYSVFRFVTEYYRGDDVRGKIFGISFSQIICIIILMYLVVKNIHRRKEQ